MKLFFLTIIILFFLNGCSTSFDLSPINQSNQEIIYNEGNAVLISEESNTKVGVYGSKVNGNIVLIVGYRNNTENDLNVFPSRVKVTGYNDKEESESFYVYSYKEYMKKIKKAQAWSNVAMAVGDGMSNANAGKTTSTTRTTGSGQISGTGNNWGSGYNISGSSTSTTETIDHDAKAKAQEKSNERQREVMRNQDLANQNLESSLLKANTIKPGEKIGGKIIVKSQSGFESRFEIEIPFGDVIHRLEFIPSSN